VGTGGFRQFFINSAGDFWRDILAGLAAIGDQQGLAMFRQTISIFPNSTPSQDRQTRLEQLNALEEENEENLSGPLNKMTARYFATSFPKREFVFDYVKSHPDEFNIVATPVLQRCSVIEMSSHSCKYCGSETLAHDAVLAASPSGS
jgi:hypothetical protein